MADFGGANASPTESSCRPLAQKLLLTCLKVIDSPPVGAKDQSLILEKSRMTSRSFTRALRTPLTRQLTAPAAQRRNFLSASKNVRACFATPLKPAAGAVVQQTRGIKTIDFAGTKETVYGNLLCEGLDSSLGLMGIQSVRIGRGRNLL